MKNDKGNDNRMHHLCRSFFTLQVKVLECK